jgi:hypothetical protein
VKSESALDTGQIEQVIEKNIPPTPADNTGADVFLRNFLGFVCAAHVLGDVLDNQ